jgi:hypothetical protein
MKRFPRIGSGRARIAAATVATLALTVFVPTFATGAPPPIGDTPPPGAVIDTVKIKGGFSAAGSNLRFVAPSTATAGDYLRVVNKTKPFAVGPHSFSLVTESSLPKTRPARKACFTKNHICKAIAGWHGKTGNIAPAGLPGWDTLGSLNKKGDSWFTTNKPDTSVVQQLTADTAAGPTRIFFLCAIHPFMKGSIEVLPPATP